MLIVEQNVAAALRIASFGYVLENGRVVFKGEAEKLLDHQDMSEFYLGDREAGELPQCSSIHRASDDGGDEEKRRTLVVKDVSCASAASRPCARSRSTPPRRN